MASMLTATTSSTTLSGGASPSRRPSLPPMPDLSHLTPEERQIIESVIMRQRQEEEKEQEMLKTLQDDFQSYEAIVRKRSDEVKQQGTSINNIVDPTQGAICEICHKTKFADGLGHQCHYCNLRSCARCGGRISLRSNKQIWACVLCKKKQEILVKTGQWYHGSMAKPVGLEVDAQNPGSALWMDPGGQGIPFHPDGSPGSQIGSDMELQGQYERYHDQQGYQQQQQGNQQPYYQQQDNQQQFYQQQQNYNPASQQNQQDLGQPYPPHSAQNSYHQQANRTSGHPQDTRSDMVAQRPTIARQESLQGRVPTTGSIKGREMRRQSSLTDPQRQVRGDVPFEQIGAYDDGLMEGGYGGQNPSRGYEIETDRNRNNYPSGDLARMDPQFGTQPADAFLSQEKKDFSQNNRNISQDLSQNKQFAQYQPGQNQPYPQRPGPQGPQGPPGVIGNDQGQAGMRPDVRNGGIANPPRNLPTSSSDIPPDKRILPDQSRQYPGAPGQARDQWRDQGRDAPANQDLDPRRPGQDSRGPYESGPMGQNNAPGNGERQRGSGAYPREDTGRGRGQEVQGMERRRSNERIAGTNGDVRFNDIRQGEYRDRYGPDMDTLSERGGSSRVRPSDSFRSVEELGRHEGSRRADQPPRRPSGYGGHRPDDDPRRSSRDERYGPAERHPDRLMHSGGDKGGSGRRMLPSANLPKDQGRRDPAIGPGQFLDPSTAAVSMGSRHRQKLDPSLRSDSLSSDPSDCARPSPPKPRRHRTGSSRQASFSSSDDGVQSTPEGTSCDEQELESESISEQDQRFMLNKHLDHPLNDRLKKDEILQAKMKKFLAHPAQWQPSADGRKLVGHMVLYKSLEGTSAGERGGILGKGTLGLKVTGGKMTQLGYLGAFITKVKRGSIADTMGRLKAGDEVVQWNGRNLRGLTFEEVYDVIFESKSDAQVELLVHRQVAPVEGGPGKTGKPLVHVNPPEMDSDSGRHSSGSQPPAQNLGKPSVTITSPGSPVSTTVPVLVPQSTHSSGTIQVKTYHDSTSNQLFVTVVSASALLPRENGQPRNPYCKLYLLPERSEKSKRRTKTVAGTLDPKWNQTFIYSPMKKSDMKGQSVQITVYDYDRIGSGEYVGETTIDLTSCDKHEKLQTYTLQRQDDSTSSVTSVSMDHLGDPVSGKGPRSSTGGSRLTDSDHSEPDLEILSRLSQGRNDVTGHESLSAAALQRFHPVDSTGSYITQGGIDGPRKRQLPKVPTNSSLANVDRVTQELEERARMLKLKLNLKQKPDTMSDSEVAHRSSRDRRYRYPGQRGGDSEHELGRVTSLQDREPITDRGYEVRRSGSSAARISSSALGLTRTFSQERDGGLYEGSSRDMERLRDSPLERSARRHERHRDGGRHRRGGRFNSDADEAMYSDASEMSDFSISKYSMRSTQSERPMRHINEFVSLNDQQAGGRSRTARCSSTEPQRIRRDGEGTSRRNERVEGSASGEERNDGSISDSAVAFSITDSRRKRRPSLSDRVASFVGFNRKSNSSSQIHQEELAKKASKERRNLPGDLDDQWPESQLESDSRYGNFIERLGPSQIVGRQVLGTPCLGEIQLSIADRKGQLEVEVIRARGLIAKPGAKILPAPYVKVYLYDGKNCIEKQKTMIARRTLDPLYQQQLCFTESYTGRILQILGLKGSTKYQEALASYIKQIRRSVTVLDKDSILEPLASCTDNLTVWGDYGRSDRKVFMGVAQIKLDDLDLTSMAIGWYKLFSNYSLVHNGSQNSGSSGNIANPGGNHQNTRT